MIDVFDEGTLTFETSVGLDETPFRYSMVCHICVWRPASDFPHHCAMEKSWTVLGWSHRDYHRDDGQKLIVYPQINSLLFSKVENYDNFQSRKHVMFIEKKEKHSLSCVASLSSSHFSTQNFSRRGATGEAPVVGTAAPCLLRWWRRLRATRPRRNFITWGASSLMPSNDRIASIRSKTCA